MMACGLVCDGSEVLVERFQMRIGAHGNHSRYVESTKKGADCRFRMTSMAKLPAIGYRQSPKYGYGDENYETFTLHKFHALTFLAFEERPPVPLPVMQSISSAALTRQGEIERYSALGVCAGPQPTAV
jgi:hypothetical protein